MAAEFRRKTDVLFEEFKKRELCYLNTERKINNNFNWNDLNMSTQEYLENINKREREMEKTYKDVIMQLEDLGQCTDQMSLKLKKLNALRNISVGFNSSSWPSIDDTFDQPLQSYYTSNFQHSSPASFMPLNTSAKAFHSFSEVNNSLPKFNSQSVSTQTDYIFCDQCHCPLTLKSKLSIPDSTNSFLNSSERLEHSEVNDTHQLFSDSNLQGKLISNDATQLDVDRNCIINGNLDASHLQTRFNAGDGMSSKEVISKVTGAAGEEDTLLKFSNNSECQRQTEMNHVESKDMVSSIKKSISPEVDNNTLNDSVIIEEAVTKSDDESMNHEFDFLESDNRINKKSNDTQTIKKPSRTDIISQGKNSNGEERNVTTYSEGNVSNSKRVSLPNEFSDPNILKERDKLIPDDTLNNDVRNSDSIKIIEDLRPDSSLSVGPPSPSIRSENASLASESDTLSDKETPLTATAAYQAMLGNVSAVKTPQNKHPVADSDSEDDIENVLVPADSKSRKVGLDTEFSNPKATGKKESISEPKPKPETKTSSVINKPQNKLSKNTRKVLGLDTSSGSEVELPTKVDVNKIDEDSDEFDFYD